MIWIAHSVYLIVFIVFLIKMNSTLWTREEFMILPSVEKEKLLQRPWKFIVLVLCFPFLDGIVRALKGASFFTVFLSDLIPALFFAWMLFTQTKQGDKLKKLNWLPYVGFFVFTLIRNIVGHERVIVIILMEIKSLIALGVFAFISLIALENPGNLPTKEERAKSDAEEKQRQEERQQREYEQRMREEQARIQAEKDARTHEAYERIVLGKKTSSGSSYGSSGSYSSYTERRERPSYSCSGCRYYDGSSCTCRSSVQYNNYIMNPTGYVCGYHRS